MTRVLSFSFIHNFLRFDFNVMTMAYILCYINVPVHTKYQNDANGIKLGINSKMTDKNATEYYKTAYMGVDEYVFDVGTALTSM